MNINRKIGKTCHRLIKTYGTSGYSVIESTLMVRKKIQFVNNSEEDTMYFQIVLVLKAHRRN